jgi:hypothetical protein
VCFQLREHASTVSFRIRATGSPWKLFDYFLLLPGQIPEWLENLKELTTLSIGNNKFEGACRVRLECNNRNLNQDGCTLSPQEPSLRRWETWGI